MTLQNPAHAGEYVIAYGLNVGPVSHAPASGTAAPLNPLAISVPPGSPSQGTCSMFDAINIGQARSVPSYVGLVPETVGVYQINFQIPDSAGVGDLPLIFVRTLTVNPFGSCLGSGLGNISTSRSSRAVTLPIR